MEDTEKKQEKRGPKNKQIDCNQFEQLAALDCTQEEIAAHFGICVDTLGVRVSENYAHLDGTPMKLSEAIKIYRESGNCQLKVSQWKRAKAGSDRMLEWLGIQRLNQKNKHDITTNGENVNNQNKLEFVIYSGEKKPDIPPL